MERVLKTILSTVVLALLLAPGLRTVGSAKGQPGKPQPQAIVLEAARDFGFLPQRAEVSHTFWLQNRGRAPLHVTKIKAGCSCTSVSEIDEPIEPGDSVAITVSFRSGRYRGKVHKKTTVYTDDPKRGELELHIIANVVKGDESAGPVFVEPFEVAFEAEDDTVGIQAGSLIFSTEQEGEYRVEFEQGPEGAKVEVENPRVLSTGQPVTITFEVTEPLPAQRLSTSSFGFRVIGPDTARISIPITIVH